jgi:hypothetical protein
MIVDPSGGSAAGGFATTCAAVGFAQIMRMTVKTLPAAERNKCI